MLSGPSLNVVRLYGFSFNGSVRRDVDDGVRYRVCVCLFICLFSVCDAEVLVPEGGAMLSVDSLQVAEEEVVESSSSRLGDIYTLVAEGCYPHAMNPIRKKNLKRYAQKFIVDGAQLTH